MLVVSKKLKYVFDSTKKYIIENEDGEKLRQDKTIYKMYKNNIISKDFIKYEKSDEEKNFILIPPNMVCSGEEDDNWELIHLDGNYKNCKIDNLEEVLFVEEDPVDILNGYVKELKKELSSKNEQIKKIMFESSTKDGKVANMQRQVLYEQSRIKELNKELKQQEKEIRRLLDIISKKKY